MPGAHDSQWDGSSVPPKPSVPGLTCENEDGTDGTGIPPIAAKAAAGLVIRMRLDRHDISPQVAEKLLQFAEGMHGHAVRNGLGGQARALASAIEDLKVMADPERIQGPTERWTTKYAAEQLGCTDRRVRQFIDAGDLLAERVDGRWQVVPDSVKRLVSERRKRTRLR